MKFPAYGRPEVTCAGQNGTSLDLYVPDHALLYVACRALRVDGAFWRTLVKPRLVSATSEDQEKEAACFFLEELAKWETAYGAMTTARDKAEGR